MSKKHLYSLLVILITATMPLAACGSANNSAPTALAAQTLAAPPPFETATPTPIPPTPTAFREGTLIFNVGDTYRVTDGQGRIVDIQYRGSKDGYDLWNCSDNSEPQGHDCSQPQVIAIHQNRFAWGENLVEAHNFAENYDDGKLHLLSPWYQTGVRTNQGG